jgi:hypothetical protein
VNTCSAIIKDEIYCMYYVCRSVQFCEKAIEYDILSACQNCVIRSSITVCIFFKFIK